MVIPGVPLVPPTEDVTLWCAPSFCGSDLGMGSGQWDGNKHDANTGLTWACEALPPGPLPPQKKSFPREPLASGPRTDTLGADLALGEEPSSPCAWRLSSTAERS